MGIEYIIGALIIGLIAGYFLRRNLSDRTPTGKRIEEYSFYPFVVNDDGLVQFDPKNFNEATRYFLKNTDRIAAQQLIIIGEQNLIFSK